MISIEQLTCQRECRKNFRS